MEQQNKLDSKSTKSGIATGHVALLAANIIWGGMAPVSKDLLNMQLMSSWSLAGLRILGGAVLFWALSLILPSSWVSDEKIEKKDFWQLCIASLLVIAANQALVIIGMEYTSPVDATIVCSMTPIFTLILGTPNFIFAGETNDAINVTNPLLGNAVCFLAQVCGACYLVFFTDIIKKYSAFTLMKWMFLISAIVVFPFTIGGIVKVQWSEMPLSGIMDVLYIVVLATCLAYLFTPIGQKHVSPTVVAIYNYLQPVVAAVISILAGLAIINWETALYACLIFVGVWLVSRN